MEASKAEGVDTVIALVVALAVLGGIAWYALQGGNGARFRIAAPGAVSSQPRAAAAEPAKLFPGTPTPTDLVPAVPQTAPPTGAQQALRPAAIPATAASGTETGASPADTAAVARTSAEPKVEVSALAEPALVIPPPAQPAITPPRAGVEPVLRPITKAAEPLPEQADANQALASRPGSVQPKTVEPKVIELPPLAGEAPAGRLLATELIQFAPGSAMLPQEARSRLKTLAQQIKAGSGVFVIAGHTDNRGKPGEHVVLSRMRADSVRYYLIKQGVPAERLKAVGYGDAHPVADNRQWEGRRHNRRIELREAH